MNSCTTYSVYLANFRLRYLAASWFCERVKYLFSNSVFFLMVPTMIDLFGHGTTLGYSSQDIIYKDLPEPFIKGSWKSSSCNTGYFLKYTYFCPQWSFLIKYAYVDFSANLYALGLFLQLIYCWHSWPDRAQRKLPFFLHGPQKTTLLFVLLL